MCVRVCVRACVRVRACVCFFKLISAWVYLHLALKDENHVMTPLKPVTALKAKLISNANALECLFFCHSGDFPLTLVIFIPS